MGRYDCPNPALHSVGLCRVYPRPGRQLSAGRRRPYPPLYPRRFARIETSKSPEPCSPSASAIWALMYSVLSGAPFGGAKIEACDGPAAVTTRTAAQSVGVAFIR
jgi:hypothetical protein